VKTSSTATFHSRYGAFNLKAFELSPDRTHLAMWLGDLSSPDPLLVRVQSSCLTGTALGASICDCRAQVEQALAQIAQEGRGLFVYLDEEARGHGLREKVNGMVEMNQGASTVTAYTDRGLPADRRTYGDVRPILAALGTTKVLRVVTNNPAKLEALANQGYEIHERLPIEIEPTELTRHYLLTKKRELGHILSVASDGSDETEA
jgi:3,4-dihydroxy 2-butanone 4-phosphate synthase/GTP cyclohydrolase II